jgi:hypothetical protein
MDSGALNGLAFTPDESVLYVDDFRRGHIRAFDIAPNGMLARQTDRVFADLCGPERGPSRYRKRPERCRPRQSIATWCNDGPVAVRGPDLRQRMPRGSGDIYSSGGFRHQGFRLISDVFRHQEMACSVVVSATKNWHFPPLEFCFYSYLI